VSKLSKLFSLQREKESASKTEFLLFLSYYRKEIETGFFRRRRFFFPKVPEVADVPIVCGVGDE